MCIISSHLPSFYFIFINILIQQQKGAGRLPAAYILEQFLKEGNGGNLRQIRTIIWNMIFFTPAVRFRMQLFYFNHLILFINCNFLIPRFYSLYIYLVTCIDICLCWAVWVCVCVCVWSHLTPYPLLGSLAFTRKSLVTDYFKTRGKKKLK